MAYLFPLSLSALSSGSRTYCTVQATVYTYGWRWLTSQCVYMSGGLCCNLTLGWLYSTQWCRAHFHGNTWNLTCDTRVVIATRESETWLVELCDLVAIFLAFPLVIAQCTLVYGPTLLEVKEPGRIFWDSKNCHTGGTYLIPKGSLRNPSEMSLRGTPV